jgi:hypothetical protein
MQLDAIDPLVSEWRSELLGHARAGTRARD